MQDKPLATLTQAILKSLAQYDNQGTRHWDTDAAMKDLAYQTGCVSKVLMQLENTRWADGKSKEDLMAQLRNELADVITDALYIANEQGCDMDLAMQEMFADDDKKAAERAKLKG
jgi:NTP pyrophosphatase (non-canonical NTP hydrolase)